MCLKGKRTNIGIMCNFWLSAWVVLHTDIKLGARPHGLSGTEDPTSSQTGWHSGTCQGTVQTFPSASCMSVFKINIQLFAISINRQNLLKTPTSLVLLWYTPYLVKNGQCSAFWLAREIELVFLWTFNIQLCTSPQFQPRFSSSHGH